MKFEVVTSKELDNYLEKDNKVEYEFKEIESYAKKLEGFSFMSAQDVSTLFYYKDNIRAFYFEEYLKGNILKDFLDKVSCYDSEVSFSIGDKRDYIKVLVTINYE